MMVFYFKAVQLKDKLAIRDQLLKRGAPMTAPAAQQTLIPSAACFHIGNADERLRTHPINISTSDWSPNVYLGYDRVIAWACHFSV
jgi:hypothetical protein